jgi:curved DNA-binding protein CbpA
MRCHYEVLEVARDASIDDIKKAYKKLALRWHPDKNIGNEEQATERFKEISQAFNVRGRPGACCVACAVALS